MKKILSLDISCNRLEFNLCLFISLFIIFIKSYFLKNYIPKSFIPDIILCLLVIFALFRRLKNLNKSNKFIINFFFSLNLCFSLSFLNLLYSEEYEKVCYYLFVIFLCIGLILLLYLLFLAVFVKGAETENINIGYSRPTLKKIFNRHIFSHWRDFNGNAGRYDFFIYGILFFCLFNFQGIVFLVPFFISANCMLSLFVIISCWSVFILYLILTFSLFIRRIKTVGLSSWHYVVLFIFPVNVIFVLLLMLGEKRRI